MRLLLAICCASGLQASSGAAYLKIPQGARATALGGAMVASKGGAEGIWYSPASLFGSSSFDATLSRMAWIGDTKNDYLSIVYGPGKQAVGIYANLLSTEDIYRDNLGNDGGKFSDGAMTVGGAYALQMGPLTLGLGGKYFSEKAESQGGSGQAFDAGAQLRAARGHLRFGLAVQNALASGGYADSSSALVSAAPYTVRGGASLAGHGLALNLEARYRPSYDEKSICGGLEYAMSAGAMGLAVRAGYDSAGLQVGDLAGLAIGAGVVMDSLVADIAWLPEGVLGNPYRLSLGWRFGSTGPEFSAAKPRASKLERKAEPAPADLVSLSVDVDGILAEGKAAEDNGDSEKALKEYRKLTKAAPDDFRGWKAIGKLQYGEGNKKEALKAFEKVLELKPTPEFKEWLEQYRAQP